MKFPTAVDSVSDALAANSISSPLTKATLDRMQNIEVTASSVCGMIFWSFSQWHFL